MIKLIRLVSSELIVAEIDNPATDGVVHLKDPFVLVPNKDGSNLNFYPWSPLSEKGSSVDLCVRHVVYYATPDEDVVSNYKQFTSTIITPQNSSKIIT